MIAVGLLFAMVYAGEISKISALFFPVPPMATAIAWIVLDEIMPPLAWVGRVAAGLGVFMATSKKQTTA